MKTGTASFSSPLRAFLASTRWRVMAAMFVAVGALALIASPYLVLRICPTPGSIIQVIDGRLEAAWWEPNIWAERGHTWSASASVRPGIYVMPRGRYQPATLSSPFRFFSVPVLGAVVVVLGIPVATLYARGRYRSRHQRCLWCGYDLAGSRPCRCPECGANG